MDKEPDGGDMVLQLLGERQGLANKATHPLSKCAVETLNMLGTLPKVEGRTVVLIDDGVATGATMRATILALRQQDPSRLIVAVPVGALDTCELLRQAANEVVCVATPEPFYGVGRWYGSFSQTSDKEVRERLHHAFQALS